MKIVLNIDKNNNVSCNIGKQVYGENMRDSLKTSVNNTLKNFLKNNTQLSDYELDSMWMSYRYCIGRHTITSHARATDIANNCYGRMNDDASVFTAYDINREIERCMMYGCGPKWFFPITSLNRIYTSAIDIYCEFINDNNITSIEELLKYKEIHVKLSDNDRGYTLETITWEEYLRPQILNYCKHYYAGQSFTEDDAWNNFIKWKTGKITNVKFYEEITKDIPNKDYFSISNIYDLFIWNNLVHLFDKEHHHKSILKDDTECEWFWIYVKDFDANKELKYKKVRFMIKDKINLDYYNVVTDDMIKEDIY